jgi:hypothetical protein
MKRSLAALMMGSGRNLQAGRGFFVAVLALLLGACSGSEPKEPSTLPPDPLVRFYPMDRATAWIWKQEFTLLRKLL